MGHANVATIDVRHGLAGRVVVAAGDRMNGPERIML
jgi:hypothetical protein